VLGEVKETNIPVRRTNPPNIFAAAVSTSYVEAKTIFECCVESKFDVLENFDLKKAMAGRSVLFINFG
jgi:hypothetical protein